MNDRINVYEYVKDTAWTEGKQWRVDHADCPAGADTRQRLYLKCVLPGGSFVGYCHNCSNYGAYFSKTEKRSISALLSEFDGADYLDMGTDKKNMDVAIATHKADMVDIEDLHIKVWLYKHYVWEDDWAALGLQQHRHHGYLYFPVGEQSIQIRSFGGGANRYYTLYHSKERKRYYTTPRAAFLGHSHLILTEDAISSHRVERELNQPSFASLGTNVSTSLMKVVESHIKPLHIWYDGDSAGRKASQKVFQELSCTRSCPTHIVVCDKSPKEYSPEELKEVWDNHIKSIK